MLSVIRDLSSRSCIIGVLVGLLISVYTCRYLTANCDVPSEFSQAKSSTVTVADSLRSSVTVVITLQSCNAEEVDSFLNRWGRDVPLNLLQFYSCCEKHTRQEFTHTQLKCSTAGGFPSLLSAVTHLRQNDMNSQWYFIGLSATYVDYNQLIEYLNRLESETLLYLGKPIRINSSKTLSTYYCDRGSGIVLSRTLLQKLYIEKCSADSSEDVCLSTNIWSSHKITCTEGGSEVWSHFTSRDSSSMSGLTFYPVMERRAVTLHLSHKMASYRKLHEKQLRTECVIVKLQAQHDLSAEYISQLSVDLTCSNKSIFNEFCVEKTSCNETSKYNIQPWVYHSDYLTYYGEHIKPRTQYPPWHSYKILKITRYFKRKIQRRYHLSFFGNYTYYARYDCNRGVEYYIDEELDNDSHQLKRTALKANFINFSMRKTEDYGANEIVYFVVPVISGLDKVKHFLSMYERVCLANHQQTSLILSVYERLYQSVNTLIHPYKLRYPKYDFRVVKVSGVFSRSRALNLGMSLLGDGDLAFHCDIDIEITDTSFLDRCRMNTVKNESIYFPEVFKYYNLDIVYRNKKWSHGLPPISRKTGHWSNYGYGMVCIYKTDHIAVGEMNNTIEGWGLEDSDYYFRMKPHKRIIFRAPDPSLRHRWHSKNCPAITIPDKYIHCRNSKYLVLGERKDLAEYIMETENISLTHNY